MLDKKGLATELRIAGSSRVCCLVIEQAPRRERTAIYARVSSSENKSNLESQADRLFNYCAAKGYQVHQVIKELGSGVNDNRPKFLGYSPMKA